ncbi:MAG TPA: hypothetical protein VLS49_14115 [Usitatibacter sp.]|nr:hypothetical protein [Usitatibacter sp.]
MVKRLVPALLLLAACGAARADLALRKEGPVSWVCGGVGAEERQALDVLRPKSRLEVLFVTAKRGGYLSDVDLTVSRNGERVLQVASEGPVCLLDAPPGNYRIEGTRDGVTRTARATLAASGGMRRVVLAFPDEPWDGIRASPEEKAQAAQP